jgi:hypothetical protein
MGDRAFAFYFPVVDRYLREVESGRAFDEITYILAQDIAAHVPARCPEVRSLYSRLSSLCDFVLESLDALESNEERSRPLLEIASAWRDVRARIARGA